MRIFKTICHHGQVHLNKLPPYHLLTVINLCYVKSLIMTLHIFQDALLDVPRDVLHKHIKASCERLQTPVDTLADRVHCTVVLMIAVYLCYSQSATGTYDCV